jgi:hypothetical protein
VSTIEGSTSKAQVPNLYLRNTICPSTLAIVSPLQANSPEPRTELDSHANMVVLGKHCFVFDGIHGKTCDVEPFDPALGTAKKVPVVDAAIAYDCPYQNKTFVLILRNALYMPNMEKNLLPPFIMREAGLLVRDVPKIHVNDPSTIDHTIQFPNSELTIPLQLWGIFSFFHSRIPTSDEIHQCDKLFITPDSTNWDPYSDHFAQNEESMLDWEGNLHEPKHRKVHILNKPLDAAPFNAYDVQIDSVLATAFTPPLDPVHDVTSLVHALNIRLETSKFSTSIGSMSAYIEDSCNLFEPVPQLQVHDCDVQVEGIQASKPHSITPQFLSKIWNIKPDLASKTLDQTTQLNRQGGDNQLSRQFSTNDRMLRYRRIKSQFYTDTFFVTDKGKSLRGNKCAQLFVSDKGYVAIYPMESKGSFKDALHQFCKEIGVPESLILDPSGEQTSKDVKRFCHQVGTTLRILEESTQWANRAELYIGLFKESIRKDLSKSNSPMRLWDYCAERRARIHNVTPRNLFQLNGTNPITATFGDQPDISNICQFNWYDWCYYREESAVQFPFQKRQLGRVLGPLKNEGNEMTQAVLTITGNVVPRRTCVRLTPEELSSPSEQAKRNSFDEAIKVILGDSMFNADPPVPPSDLTMQDLLADDDEEVPIELPEEDPVDAGGRAVLDKPFTDLLIHAEVLLPQGEDIKSAKVKGRSKDKSGSTIGSYDPNPLLNSIIYDVEFPDGVVKQYAANTIAENMYSQVDHEGHSQSLLKSIIDYKKDGHAVTKSNMYIHTKSGQRRLRKTTIGWKLLVQFRDGSEQWIPLKVLKETNPVDVAEFAVAREIDDQPAFNWWVPYTIRKRD